MSSFLKFIKEDIDAKRTLVSSMPKKNKRDQKKLNDKIAEFEDKYNEYKDVIHKYIDTKAKSLEVKVDDKSIKELEEKIKELESLRYLLNPSNTYFEKLSIDDLIYQLEYFNDFNFEELMQIVNDLLTIFEKAGVKLSVNDFNYTPYVKEYMEEVLLLRRTKNTNYSSISDAFEKVYWRNPDIIKHIELNFRKLVRKNIKAFESYTESLQKQATKKHKIYSYEECLQELKKDYYVYTKLNKENVSDIIELAKTNEIDINNYFDDSKLLLTTYEDLMINNIDLEDKDEMDKFYDSLHKLRINLVEYSNYLKFTPLMDYFKENYEKELKKLDEKTKNNPLKDLETQINEKEKRLDRINKQITNGGRNFFGIAKGDNVNKLKMDTIHLANELLPLYQKHDAEFFKSRVKMVLHESFSTYELLHLYYSFDYFKKTAVKKIYELETYDELIKTAEEFDEFATNPTNIIINSVPVFDKNNISQIIMNKYRLDNINVDEESLADIEILLEKIDLLLRVNEIKNSKSSVDEIWFISQVARINENLKNQSK